MLWAPSGKDQSDSKEVREKGHRVEKGQRLRCGTGPWADHGGATKLGAVRTTESFSPEESPDAAWAALTSEQPWKCEAEASLAKSHGLMRSLSVWHRAGLWYRAGLWHRIRLRHTTGLWHTTGTPWCNLELHRDKSSSNEKILQMKNTVNMKKT